MTHDPNPATPVATLDERGGGARTWLVFAFLYAVVCGLLYPAIAVGLGGLLFADAARGSLVERGGRVVGSALVAQPFADARYFAPRPSAANFDPRAAAGSNWAPSNPALAERIAAQSQAIAEREQVAASAIPPDLVTASGSGLDPHISVAAAELQVARVARARGLDAATVRAMVAAHVEAPTLGILGQPRVNVLALNLALDAAGSAAR